MKNNDRLDPETENAVEEALRPYAIGRDRAMKPVEVTDKQIWEAWFGRPMYERIPNKTVCARIRALFSRKS